MDKIKKKPKKRKCFFCNNDAPYGFGLPGPRKDIPVGKRGYIWVCRNHLDDAEKKQKDALGKAPAPWWK